MVRALNVLFPLYIYPQNCQVSRDACAWKPLYDALDAYPTLQFTLVIDPNSGPGPNGSFPDASYVAGISALNAYANVKTIGYVASTRAAKPVAQYQAEVNTYAHWASHHPAGNIAMHGIFVDEMSNDPGTISYYSQFSDFAHKAFGNTGTGAELVVLNPGATTPQAFFDVLPRDVFVTFENSASQMWAPFTIFTDPLYKDTPRDRQAAIIHNFGGSTVDLVNITDTVGEIEAMKYVFVTTQSNYNSFPTNWQTFVAAVNGTNIWMAEHPDWYPRA